MKSSRVADEPRGGELVFGDRAGGEAAEERVRREAMAALLEVIKQADRKDQVTTDRLLNAMLATQKWPLDEAAAYMRSLGLHRVADVMMKP